MASHFELDLVRFAIALDARRCFVYFLSLGQQNPEPRCVVKQEPRKTGLDGYAKCVWREERRERVETGEDLHEASFRLQISMNCLMSDTSFGMMARITDGG